MTFAPSHGFSLASIFATAINVDDLGPSNDSGDTGFAALYGDRLEIITPDPTPDQRREYGLPRRGDWNDGDRAAAEFRESFFPLMNALWPVDLAYGRSADEAAALMNKHGGATTLICVDGERYFIAMTGGGMDLSWHIAAAYVCCGCVPPVEILDGLHRSPFEASKQARAAILKAWRQGARHLRHKAASLMAGARQAAAKRKG